MGQGHSESQQTLAMANFRALRGGFGAIGRHFQAVTVRSGRLASLEGLVSRRWSYAGSSEHTLAVRQQIQETRRKGQEAGGTKRIDAQHDKVAVLIIIIIIIRLSE